MAKRYGLLRRIFQSRLFWIFILVLLLTAAWQAWTVVAHRVITHELFGQVNEDKAVTLIFVGDTGSGSTEQKTVAGLMEELCVTFRPAGVVLLGDNFYYTGVESTRDPLWESRFETVYSGDCLKKIPFYAILGNHDYRGVADAQIEYTRVRAGRWTMPARFYSLKFGNIVEIGAADTTIADRCWLPALCSIDWLIDKLSNSSARWKVLVGHHPILSGGKYRSLKGLAYFALPSLYCRSGAHAYISGHDHGLQHLQTFDSWADCSIEQFVSAGGGASLYEITNLPGRTRFASSAHGVLLGRFSATEQQYDFFKVGHNGSAYHWAQRQE
jgi:acid phosphatase